MTESGWATAVQPHHPRMRLVFLFLLLATPMALPAATIVCLGDSLTAGQGVDEDQAFPAVVQRLARADGRDWTVSNAGISGDTSAGGLRRVAWLIKGKPDWAFVALGANDGLRGQPVTATRDNLVAIADKFRAAGVQVAFAGMRLPTNYGEVYLTEFTALFPQIAQEKKIPLMPFLLDGVGGVPALNQADGIHPTVEGQEKIARNVYAFLKPLVDAGKSPTAGTSAEAGK